MPTPHLPPSHLDAVLHLLQAGPDATQAAPAWADAGLARLRRADLLRLEAHAWRLRESATEQARTWVEVAREGLDRGLSADSLRCLLVDALVRLQEARRWGQLATNAEFFRRHPEERRRDALQRGSEKARGRGARAARGSSRAIGASQSK